MQEWLSYLAGNHQRAVLLESKLLDFTSLFFGLAIEHSLGPVELIMVGGSSQ